MPASPFVPEDVTITSHDGQQFIVHLGQVVGHGGQSTVFAAERVDDGLACVAKVFRPLIEKDRTEYEKTVRAVMSLNGRPVSETHLLPIFAYLHQGLSATEVGAIALSFGILPSLLRLPASVIDPAASIWLKVA